MANKALKEPMPLYMLAQSAAVQLNNYMIDDTSETDDVGELADFLDGFVRNRQRLPPSVTEALEGAGGMVTTRQESHEALHPYLQALKYPEGSTHALESTVEFCIALGKTSQPPPPERHPPKPAHPDRHD